MKLPGKLGSVLGVLILSSGCGQLKLGDKVSLALDPATQQAKVEMEMSDGLEVSLTGSFPIDDGKGEIYFVPATKEANARIGLALNVGQFVDIPLPDQISTLPNGNALPVAMTPPLYRYHVYKSKEYNIDLAGTVTPELQLATIVGISKMSTKYVPGGVSICQNFRNKEKIAFAAVCLYGPALDGSASGGIFMGANFGQVIHKNDTPQANTFMAMSRGASNSLDISQFSLVLTTNESKIIDPQNKLSGKNALIAARNVQKILSAKH